MILLVFLLAVTAATDVDVEVDQPCPSCILLNTTCYNVSYLFDLDAPFRSQVVIHKMGLLRSKNTLFFSFEPFIEDKEFYKTGFVNLDDPSQAGVIAGTQILNFGTFDVDQDNSWIYFGGSDGIFVLDTNVNKMSSYSSRGDAIQNVFYKNYVYFNRYNDKGIIIKIGDEFKTILEYWHVKKFVVTKYDVVVFLSNYGMFVAKGNIEHRVSKNAYFRGITIDLDGNVYAWWIDGIYKVVIEKKLTDSKLVRVAKLPSIGALTFDNDNNILFTSDKSLYIMQETKSGCGATNRNSTKNN